MKRDSECRCCPQRVRRPDAHLCHHQGAAHSGALPMLRKQPSVLTLLIAPMMFFQKELKAVETQAPQSIQHPVSNQWFLTEMSAFNNFGNQRFSSDLISLDISLQIHSLFSL